MNERIKELAKQAGYRDIFDNDTKARARLEKYTELIVKECAAMARGFEFAVKRDGLSTAMKEHFGVEE